MGHYDVDQTTAKITETIQKELGDKNKIPKVKLAFTSPKVTSGRCTFSTKAYAIESQGNTSHKMDIILKKSFRRIEYQMRRKHPDSFQKMIRAQTSTVLAHSCLSTQSHRF
jgi:hypothetical protein